MFNSVKGIRIQGGIFKECTDLSTIFERRFNIVFGRNGSGKTTIGKAIDALARNDNSVYPIIQFLPEQNATSDNAGNDYRQHIHVFNESFVDNNVRLKKDGLQTIAMIGDMAAIDKNLEHKSEEKNNLRREIERVEAKLDGPTKILNETEIALVERLRKDGEYADRHAQINELKTRSSITQNKIHDVLESCINTVNSDAVREYPKAIKDLRLDLEKRIGFVKTSKEGEKINWAFSPIEIDFESLGSLLRQRIMEPNLTVRDQFIIKLLGDPSRAHYLDETEKVIIDEKARICPLCHQPVTDEYRISLEQKIREAMNQEVQDFKARLETSISQLTYINIALPQDINGVFSKSIEACMDSLMETNEQIDSVRKALEERKKTPFGDPDTRTARAILYKFENKISQLNYNLKSLERDVSEYNIAIDSRRKAIMAANTENKILTCTENWDMINQYMAAYDLVQKATEEYNTLKEQEGKLDQEIENLSSRLKQTDIAQEYINEFVSFVFFDKHRLVLSRTEGDLYKLQSRGHDVSPDNVSVGERNILALAYFFASLFKGKDNERRYSGEKLVVIDDPISSFDAENRLSVISTLKREIGEILRGDRSSKVLLLSHDLQSVFDFATINEEFEQDNAINNNRKNNRNNRKNTSAYPYQELKKRTLIKLDINTKNEYRSMLINIYNYAVSPNEESGLEIGNQMRRVLEAYSTFVYQKGFPNMINKTPEVADAIGNELLSTYKNFMSRLLLNSESHSIDRIHSGRPWTSLFSEEEKQRTAYMTLLFLYRINPAHLKYYLGEYHENDSYYDNSRFNNIESWAKNNLEKAIDNEENVNYSYVASN